MYPREVKIKVFSTNWRRLRGMLRMSPNTVLLGFIIICVCVYLTLSVPLNRTDNVERFKDLQHFHQFYLKGDWIMIPSPAAEAAHTSWLIRPKRSLCHTFIGRLGNEMFQYASIYSLAKNSDLDMVMSSSYNLPDVFSKLAKSSNNFRPCLQYTKLFERDPYHFESSITVLLNDTDYLVEGFLQSWKYFEPYKHDLHHQFTFTSSINQQAQFSLSTTLDSFRQYRNLKNPIGTFVGVHVRRGDYANILRGNSTGVNLPTSSYFQKAKDYFRSHFPSPVFVVCSDDINWCMENIEDDDAIFIRGNTPEVDLALLASLNHTITSFGTFTFWAAWLTNGTTVYPKDIVDEHFGGRKDIYLRDHIYHTWIPL